VFKRFQRIHFVGIGGIGMSGIAELLLNLGYAVSGSDLKLSPTTERLSQLGAKIYLGHDAAHVREAHVVVFSSAVDSQNPELAEARRRQQPVIPRAEMLAELMRLKYGIAVAGAHGKTTTTSLVASVLNEAKFDPTLIVGGRLNAFGINARLGGGEWMVVEADESDRSFLKIDPTIAVITNIDREHLDHYRDLADIQEAFVSFANKVPFYGSVIACVDDGPTRAILPRLERRVVTYGHSEAAELRVTAVRLRRFESDFEVQIKGRTLGKFQLRIPGLHNILNATAAVAVGLELNAPLGAIQQGLAEFRGTERRFELKGEHRGIVVIDDYGHHPAEITATLTTLRQCGFRRAFVVFQPHRYSRTKFLFDDFLHAFDEADEVVLTEIYPASELPIEGISGRSLATGIEQQSRAQIHFVPRMEDIAVFLLPRLRSGDVVLTLGAGNIGMAGDQLLNLLAGQEDRVPQRKAGG
jgi:UDP-N-acetylmuramate--alanine ligase